MRFLLDQNQSPALALLLTEAGHPTEHVRDLELGEAFDAEVLEAANSREAVLVSGDTDFGELLALSNATGPSVILFRRQEGRRAGDIAALLLANLSAFEADLKDGAFVVIDSERVRIRRLPFRPIE